MKANELRIGNLILMAFENYIETVNARTIGFINIANNKGQAHPFDPIPLTEEWLLKLGFDKIHKYKWHGNGYDYQPAGNWTERTDYVNDKIDHFISIKKEFSNHIHDPDFGGYYNLYCNEWYERCCEGRIDTIIKYVHQLQNLYFALTEEELELK